MSYMQPLRFYDTWPSGQTGSFSGWIWDKNKETQTLAVVTMWLDCYFIPTIVPCFTGKPEAIQLSMRSVAAVQTQHLLVTGSSLAYLDLRFRPSGSPVLLPLCFVVATTIQVAAALSFEDGRFRPHQKPPSFIQGCECGRTIGRRSSLRPTHLSIATASALSKGLWCPRPHICVCASIRRPSIWPWSYPNDWWISLKCGYGSVHWSTHEPHFIIFLKATSPPPKWYIIASQVHEFHEL